MLSHYRILDLTTEKAFICGRALSDFGAEVIKIEKPGGDPARFKGLFYKDDYHPEKNLTWFAFNANKKGITLDIDNPKGQEIFRKLVETADVVLESFAPGYLESLGLGYKDLSKTNPGIILTSITGFGQAGPYRNYKDPDIVVRALGGLVYVVGYQDRPPLTVSYKHTHTLGAINGALGTMIALAHRVHTGLGQHVEGITQQALVIACSAETEGPYNLFNKNRMRTGQAGAVVTLKDGSSFDNPLIWKCKDGYVALNLLLNLATAKNNRSMMEFIKKDGIDTGTFTNWNWEVNSWQDMSRVQAEELLEIISRFFMNHTKKELLELAIENRFQLGPCNNAEDVLNYPQLQARGFWKEIEHPELDTTFKYPGGAVVMSQGYVGPRRCAPRIGEHNDMIYQELGISPDEQETLKKQSVI